MPQNIFKGLCDTCGLVITVEEAVSGYDKVRDRTYCRNRCKPCQADYQRARYNRNVVGTDKHQKYLDKCQRNHLLQKYGLTKTKRDELFAKGCEVCGSYMRLAIDHDHSTKGTYRGVLCNDCNTALGMVKEDKERLLGLVKYLERNAKPITIS